MFMLIARIMKAPFTANLIYTALENATRQILK